MPFSAAFLERYRQAKDIAKCRLREEVCRHVDTLMTMIMEEVGGKGVGKEEEEEQVMVDAEKPILQDTSSSASSYLSPAAETPEELKNRPDGTLPPEFSPISANSSASEKHLMDVSTSELPASLEAVKDLIHDQLTAKMATDGAWSVIDSDSTDIPEDGVLVDSGTVDQSAGGTASTKREASEVIEGGVKKQKTDEVPEPVRLSLSSISDHSEADQPSLEWSPIISDCEGFVDIPALKTGAQSEPNFDDASQDNTASIQEPRECLNVFNCLPVEPISDESTDPAEESLISQIIEAKLKSIRQSTSMADVVNVSTPLSHELEEGELKDEVVDKAALVVQVQLQEPVFDDQQNSPVPDFVASPSGDNSEPPKDPSPTQDICQPSPPFFEPYEPRVTFRTVYVNCLQPNCPLTFRKIDRLNDHMFKCHSLLVFRCPLEDCDASYNSSHDLKSHYIVDHGHLIWWHCPLCPRQFVKGGALSYHLYRNHSRGRFECTKFGCYFSAEFRGNLLDHIFAVHQADGPGRGSSRSFQSTPPRIQGLPRCASATSPIPSRMSIDEEEEFREETRDEFQAMNKAKGGRKRSSSRSLPSPPPQFAWPSFYEEEKSREKSQDRTPVKNKTSKQNKAPKQAQVPARLEGDIPSKHKYNTIFLKCVLDGCSEFFLGKRKLFSHLRHYHDMLPVFCIAPGCRKSFTNRSQLEQHVNFSHTAISQWRCCKCGDIFKHHCQLFIHRHRSHEEGQFRCSVPNCPKVAKFRSIIIDHYDAEHGEEEEEEVTLIKVKVEETEES